MLWSNIDASINSDQPPYKQMYENSWKNREPQIPSHCFVPRIREETEGGARCDKLRLRQSSPPITEHGSNFVLYRFQKEQILFV